MDFVAVRWPRSHGRSQRLCHYSARQPPRGYRSRSERTEPSSSVRSRIGTDGLTVHNSTCCGLSSTRDEQQFWSDDHAFARAFPQVQLVPTSRESLRGGPQKHPCCHCDLLAE